MMQNTKIIVLILSYNGKHLLDDSVSSYLANDYKNFEVVVIDNGSTDGTLWYVKEKWTEVFVLRTEKNLGYSGGFNFGLNYAFNQKNADYVLITNNDVKADKNVISELVKVAITDNKIGFVTGKVYYFEKPDVLQTVGKEYCPVKWNGNHIGGRKKDEGQYDVVCERYFIDDIYTLVSKEVYNIAGAYDTTFFLQCEEWDWQARAKKHGFKIMFTPYAEIWHKESMTIGKWGPTKAYYDARNPGIVIMKYKDATFFKKYFWQHTRNYFIKGSLKNVMRGKIIIALAIIRGYFSMIAWGIRNRKLNFKSIF